MRQADTVARFGGDEFVVLLVELNADKAKSTTQAAIVAEKLRASLNKPYVLKMEQEGNAETAVQHFCASSMGVVLFLDNESTPDEILKRADLAMYQAKKGGGNLVCFSEE